MAAEPVEIKLFISSSLGEVTIVQLIQEAACFQNITLVIRGVAPHDRNLTRTIQRWQQRFEQAKTTAPLIIDPAAFQHSGIDRVPALSLQVNSRTELVAYGITSGHWLLKQFEHGRRGDIGTYGATYPITETDLLATLLSRLQQQDWHQFLAKAQRRLEKKAFSYGVDQRRWGTLGSVNIPKGLTYLHAHVYSLPLIEMLNMFTGIGGCTSDLVDFDLMNLSEVDPSWNHPELAALLSPDHAAYANPAAMNACASDGLAALNSQPKDSLHWCAGSWGNIYPLSGFTSTYGHFADNTSLLATMALAKIHRIGLARKTIGEEAQCHSKITPWLPKSQYKMSMLWPEPEKHKAHWIGASAATWGMHRHPLGKDDAMYLVWQYRDCCQTISQ